MTQTNSPLLQLMQRVADAVRDPSQPAPAGMADTRLAVYRELVLNNIRSFVRSAFPVLRSIVGDELWDAKIGVFVQQTAMHSPYFIDIPKAFYDWLLEHADDLPPFAVELAYYEWLELDLYRRQRPLPALSTPLDVTAMATKVWQLAACVELVASRFPVHQLSASQQWQAPPAEPTFLALYRDATGQVQFMQLTALSMAVLQLLQAQPQPLEQLQAQLAPLVPQLCADQLLQGLKQLLSQCLQQGVVTLGGVESAKSRT